VTRIIAIALQKGGVGKTTTAQHLAHALAMRGHRVLLVDLDAQASTTQRYNPDDVKGTMANVLGMDGPPTETLRQIVIPTYQENLYLAPASEDLAKSDVRLGSDQGGAFVLDVMFREQKLPFGYVILDTAPGRSNLLMAALVAADEVIVPVQLSPMGFEGFAAIDETIMAARRLQDIRGNVRLRYRAIVPTFYSPGQIVSDGFLEALKESDHPDYEGQPLPLAPLPVPETTAFERASAPLIFETENGPVQRARTIFEMPSEGPDSPTGRGQEAYMKLAEFVDAV
jgi:chromosome partitioning protein